MNIISTAYAIPCIPSTEHNITCDGVLENSNRNWNTKIIFQNNERIIGNKVDPQLLYGGFALGIIIFVTAIILVNKHYKSNTLVRIFGTFIIFAIMIGGYYLVKEKIRQMPNIEHRQ